MALNPNLPILDVLSLHTKLFGWWTHTPIKWEISGQKIVYTVSKKSTTKITFLHNKLLLFKIVLIVTVAIGYFVNLLRNFYSKVPKDPPHITIIKSVMCCFVIFCVAMMIILWQHGENLAMGFNFVVQHLITEKSKNAREKRTNRNVRDTQIRNQI